MMWRGLDSGKELTTARREKREMACFGRDAPDMGKVGKIQRAVCASCVVQLECLTDEVNEVLVDIKTEGGELVHKNRTRARKQDYVGIAAGLDPEERAAVVNELLQHGITRAHRDDVRPYLPEY